MLRHGQSLKLLSLAVLVVVLACPGCVRRRLTVRSSPPGATVFVDDLEIGRTPVSTPFTFYGTRKLQLVRDGYEIATQKEKLVPPWYQIPPLDFVTENLWPGEIRDERVVDVELVPHQPVDANQVVERGQSLRDHANRGTGIPLLGAQPN